MSDRGFTLSNCSTWKNENMMGVGNKFYEGEPLECDVTLKATLLFKIRPRLDEDMSTAEIWNQFDRGLDYIWRAADTILKNSGVVIKAREVQDGVDFDILTIDIINVEPPLPVVVPCKTKGCPYKNYFGVCRNCEDDHEPDPKLFEGYRTDLRKYKKYLKSLRGKVIKLSKKTKLGESLWFIDDEEHKIKMYGS